MQFEWGMLGMGALIAAALMAAYGALRLLLMFEAWWKRKEGPRDRVMVSLAMVAVAGFAVGAVTYAPYMQVMQCQDAGQSVRACVSAELFPSAPQR